MGTGRIDTIQVPYNPAHREVERTILPLADDLGLGILLMRPLGEGQLMRLLAHPGPARATAPVRHHHLVQALLKWGLSDPRVHCSLTATAQPGPSTQNAAGGSPPIVLPAAGPVGEETWLLDGLDKKGVDQQGNELSTRSLVMAFAPGSTQLGLPSRYSDRLDARRRPSVVDAVLGDWAGGATSFEPWLNDTGGDVAGTVCRTTDGYERPDYPDSTADHPSPSGSPIDPYALGYSEGSSSLQCRATTGT